jgi:putative sterol carrier protein
MAITLPTDGQEWIDEWAVQLNESEAYSEAGQGWGVDFNGVFLFDIQPDDAYDGENLMFEIDVQDGTCHEARQVDDEDDVDWGFAYRGPYTNWKGMIQGEIGAIDGLMSGKFDLDGDMQKVLQYSDAATVMTENAAEIDTEFEY